MGIEGLFAKGTIPVLEKALAFHERRHALLAQNIANVSTPDYRPVDLDEGEFQSLLRQAAGKQQAEHPRRFTLGASEHFSMREDGALQARAEAIREGQTRHDGNPFNVEREMVRLADNTLAYERAAQLLTGSYKLLEMAIRGRAG